MASRAGGFPRWLRATSERYLKLAAQAEIARRYGGRVPAPPRGAELFWLKVYAPIYHLLPAALRTAVIARLPGSHRQTWTYPERPTGPADLIRRHP